MRQQMMLKINPTMGMFLIIAISLFACTKNRFPNLVVAEAGMVTECQYLDTISETSDPGKFVTDYQWPEYYDGELKVLQRANNMEATHIVWLYNHPIGSAASAYRCAK
jgi:hypothetical protein